jgi:hypothetical protein
MANSFTACSPREASSESVPLGSGMLIRFISQSMSSQPRDNVSEGVLGHRTSENLRTQNPFDWFVETEHFLVL